jgi:hypothetical protein
MPVTALLRGREFAPEIIGVIRVAFASTCERLCITDTADPVAAVLAEKLIQLVDRGVIDADALSDAALKQLMANPPGLRDGAFAGQNKGRKESRRGGRLA